MGEETSYAYTVEVEGLKKYYKMGNMLVIVKRVVNI